MWPIVCVAYRMASTPMTLGDPEGHFCCLKLSDYHNLGNVACFINHMLIDLLQVFSNVKLCSS